MLRLLSSGHTFCLQHLLQTIHWSRVKKSAATLFVGLIHQPGSAYNSVAPALPSDEPSMTSCLTATMSKGCIAIVTAMPDLVTIIMQTWRKSKFWLLGAEALCRVPCLHLTCSSFCHSQATITLASFPRRVVLEATTIRNPLDRGSTAGKLGIPQAWLETFRLQPLQLRV